MEGSLLGLQIMVNQTLIIAGEVDPNSLCYSISQYEYYFTSNVEYITSIISVLF